MDILRVLEQLQEMVEKPRTFGPLTFGFNKEELTMQIAKVRATVPQEMKQAVHTVRESERLIGSAREDANMTLENARKEAKRIVEEAARESERILEQTRIQQERLLAENEILKLAKSQSEELRHQADRDAKAMQREADRYAMDVLVRLERVVSNAMAVIDKGKKELDTGAQQVSLPAGREKTRV